MLSPFYVSRNWPAAFDDVSQDIDQLWQVALPDQKRRTTTAWQPRVDIKENDKQIIINGDLPGVKKEDLHVELHDQLLTISGQKKTEKEEKNDKYHCVERSFGSFSRSFSLPDGVSANDIKADLSDGVLQVTVTKPAAPQPKKVKINVN